MFKKTLFSVIVAIFFYCLTLNAQIMEQEYPELKQVMPYGPDNLCKTIDNGFAFVGYSSENNVYMVKLNSEYEIEWHKQVYARPGQTGTKNIVQDDEGFFYVGGSCYDDNNNYKNCYVVKLDSLGNIVKEKVWKPENSKNSGLINFVLAKNGLMVLNSVSFEIIKDYVFYYTTFLNKELEIVSEKQRTKTLIGTESFRAICSNETGFLLVGLGSMGGLRLKKIENDSIVWEKTIDNTVQDSALYRFIPLKCNSVNDGYLITGYTKNYEPGLVLIDKLGNLIWVKEFNVGPASSWGIGKNCWESKYNDGYIVACTDGDDFVSVKIFVMKVDYSGEIQWQQESPGAVKTAVYLENGNIVCVGRTQPSMTCLKVFFHDTVGIDSEPTVPEAILLFQNYPNPFNASTTISFDLPKNNHVKLVVYNIIGNKISVLVNEKRIAGYHSVIWNPGDIASGVYIYQLTIGKDKVFTKKMLLIK